MRGKQIPHYFALIASPLEIARGAEYRAEGLGVMCGMQTDKAHPAEQNAALYLCHQLVVHFLVSHMSPPDKHVGIVKQRIGQTLLRIVKRGKADLKRLVL